MKHLYILVLPILILLSYGGCSSDSNNKDCVSTLAEIQNSECLAEDMLDLCFGLSCDTIPPTGVPELFRSSCSAIDCSTLECTDMNFTELGFNPEGMLFSTVILDGQNLGSVQCQFFQN